MIHGEIRQFEHKFKNKIFEILKNNNILLPYMKWNIDLSSNDEDCNLSYDMTFNGKTELSVRIRRNSYLKFRDFTIRAKSKNGYECEIDKIKKGLGNIYFYGWMNQKESDIIDWVVIDINKIRSELDKGTFRMNNDGTGFMFYSIDWLQTIDALIAEQTTQNLFS